MTDDRAASRAAHLLPEERAVDSADPKRQASALLAESDERTTDPQGTAVEHRTSAQATE